MNLEIDVEFTNQIELDMEISTGTLDLCVDFVDFGQRSTLCPIITCIDGGAPSTSSYPPINGFLDGGTP